MHMKFPGFVSKDGVKKWPFVNFIAYGNSTFYLNRANTTKEERDAQVNILTIILFRSKQ